ncbi:NADP-dependent dehydrogenase-like protein [Lentithecium fluviatile CBS 122367]|uniref:NADP-dependent dehydrogenase-like protein n=1 Tax=Lentithecium fluviatile CBS 122367 TaxID=1168545 RepID=A0A6G1JID0_9PLEO|nr:NADP-dependent dehydrogenase-like protein [Lentithecium fluviatile CBS 122367]
METWFITGASRGIGLELVRQLISTSSTTIIATVRTISPSLAELQAKSPNLQVVICDISSAPSIAALSTTLPTILAPHQKITHLINNAAVLLYPSVPATSLTASILSANLIPNVLGPAQILATTLPHLSPGALILNITSGIASLSLVSRSTIPAAITAYSISKCALNMLSVHQAAELRGRCRVVCMDPGHVKTEMGGEGATVEIEDSVRGILGVVRGLGKDEEGDREGGRARFVNWLGEEVEW